MLIRTLPHQKCCCLIIGVTVSVWQCNNNRWSFEYNCYCYCQYYCATI